jgi:hypothetical protein
VGKFGLGPLPLLTFTGFSRGSTADSIRRRADSSTDKKLSRKDIVEGAAFAPASDYELESNDHGRQTYAEPTADVVLHKGQHFTVAYTGTTPNSGYLTHGAGRAV